MLVFIGRKPDPRSRQTGIQVKQVECKPCAPGTWNTCKEKANCRWFIPQSMDNTLGDDIHVFPGGPGEASFFISRVAVVGARDARLFFLPSAVLLSLCVGEQVLRVPAALRRDRAGGLHRHVDALEVPG